MVHFVGAGPGDPELITVKGRHFLEKADVIIYTGSLVNPEVLACAKENCRIYNSAHMDLGKVMAVIQDAEAHGQMVVRLHTGDPSVYSTIREQMRELDEADIDYDVTPGVSAFQASAAALNAELTLPGVSQSVILTRASGRTKVPGRESIASFARHQATMALYLSSSYAENVQSQLRGGGYADTTPVDIVYKASWPEQKIVRSDVAHFPEAMAEKNITKTALILVGEALRGFSGITGRNAEKGGKKENTGNSLKGGYDAGRPKEERPEPQMSKLYDATFTTGYRKARKNLIVMISCSLHGTEQMYLLKNELERRYPQDEVAAFVKCKAHPDNTDRSIHEIVSGIFDQALAIIFFASTGIAVRGTAHFLRSKATDPAVLAVDEAGKYCIPVVSGHLGGANEYAREVASILHAEPVITTASDQMNRFAIDVFAKKNHLAISNLETAKNLEARIVAGEEVRMFSDYSISGNLSDGVRLTDRREQADIIISTNVCREREHGPEPLYLIPILFDIGIGCRRGISEKVIEGAVRKAMESCGGSFQSIRSISSIDLKKNERGILEFSAKIGVEPRFYSAEELAGARTEGGFTESDFVRKTTGVGDVCERAAVMQGGKLLIRKTAQNGVTVAVAVNPDFHI